MLYVSTRDNRDAYTVNRAMRENRCPDGGHFLPFRHPRFSPEELEMLLADSSGQCIAEVLNRLFNTRFTGPDVELRIGRHPVRIEPLQHRILVAECWHTPGYRFQNILKTLSGMVTGDNSTPTGWTEIAVRSAVLFGVFSDLRRNGILQADVSCVAGDCLMPAAAWYARCWGLPIGNIICCCNENHGLWNLLSQGQMQTDAVSIPTLIPAADIAVPDHLERIIHECGGLTETQRYLTACRTGRSYIPSDLVHGRLRGELSASVVSSQRLGTTVRGIYATCGTLLSFATALAYAGLTDHRTRTGSTGYSVIWSEDSPAEDAELLSGFLGIPAQAIQDNF